VTVTPKARPSVVYLNEVGTHNLRASNDKVQEDSLIDLFESISAADYLTQFSFG
jgi:hypothetical protein